MDSNDSSMPDGPQHSIHQNMPDGGGDGRSLNTTEALSAGDTRFRALAAASGGVFYQMSADWSEMHPLDGRGLVNSNDAPITDWLQRNIPASEHTAIRQGIADCIEHKTVFEMEHRVYRPDHTIGWTYSRAVPVLDEAGRIAEWIGSATDITGRKTADEQLRRAHNTFYHLIQNNPFGIYVVDCDFKLRQVSLGAQNVFAHVPRPLLGRDFAEVLRSIWAEPFASDAVALFRRTLDTGDPYVAQKTVEKRQDITVVEAYDWRIERITLPDGRYGVVCYFYDLSERQQWEAALAASEARLQLTADAIPALIAYVDTERRYQFVNAAYRDWFGLAPEQVTGRPLKDVVGEAVYAERLPQIDQALSGQRVRFENAMPHASLGQRETETSYVPDVAEDGTVRGFVVLVYDMTERMEAQRTREQLLASEQAARAEAERAGRTKDGFLATLSHELRTPLNAILGWSQILRSGGEASGEDLEKGLATIERNARAQTQIIEDLLDMSRITSGKLRLDIQPVDLAAVVQAGIDTVRPAADAKGIGVHAVLDPGAGRVSGDPNRLHQVVWNLLINAIKFTPSGGRVQVVLKRINAQVEISVIDTGQGIGPEFLPHVFDRFRQADSSTTRQHGGLGLGLSIVKQLVELHGGTVRVQSAGIGQGSVFTVVVPLLAVRPEPEPDAKREHSMMSVPSDLKREASRQLQGVRILVVDDEADASAFVRRLLEDCGAVVRIASSAAEAMSMLQADRPDVLISDIGMPGEDGYTLMRRVRALRRDHGGGTPSVALTAYARPEDRIRAVRAGFNMHVVKPVEPVELISMVASLIEQNRA